MRLAESEDYGQIHSLLMELSPDSPNNELAVKAFMSSMVSDSCFTVVEDAFHPLLGRYLEGVGTLYILPKMTHGGKPVGQIEDVVVNREYRKQGVGRAIVKRLTEIAKEKGCYKVQLNCSESNEEFYNKCGFTKHENVMRKDLI